MGPPLPATGGLGEASIDERVRLSLRLCPGLGGLKHGYAYTFWVTAANASGEVTSERASFTTAGPAGLSCARLDDGGAGQGAAASPSRRCPSRTYSAVAISASARPT